MGALAKICHHTGVAGVGGIFVAYCCGWMGVVFFSGMDIDMGSFAVWRGFFLGLLFMILIAIDYTATFKKIWNWYKNKYVIKTQ